LIGGSQVARGFEVFASARDGTVFVVNAAHLGEFLEKLDPNMSTIRQSSIGDDGGPMKPIPNAFLNAGFTLYMPFPELRWTEVCLVANLSAELTA
jgi:hypothetical protein